MQHLLAMVVIMLLVDQVVTKAYQDQVAEQVQALLLQLTLEVVAENKVMEDQVLQFFITQQDHN
jgi:hypothetical protein